MNMSGDPAINSLLLHRQRTVKSHLAIDLEMLIAATGKDLACNHAHDMVPRMGDLAGFEVAWTAECRALEMTLAQIPSSS